jgi:acyl-CoA thioesterase
VEIKIGYFGSVRSGLLTCNSTVINKGRKIASIESEISNDNTLIAKASGTFYIYKNK